MKKFIKPSLLTLLSLLAFGCQSHTVQTTSGREYLNGYGNPDQPVGEAGSIEEEVRRIANVEPTLRFPARIGLAKLYNGRITNLTAEEVEAWEEAKKQMGSEFGEFVPVNALIAELVSGKEDGKRRSPSDIFRKVRLGSARQHLDYVLLYEIFSETKSTKLACPKLITMTIELHDKHFCTRKGILLRIPGVRASCSTVGILI